MKTPFCLFCAAIASSLLLTPVSATSVFLSITTDALEKQRSSDTFFVVAWGLADDCSTRGVTELQIYNEREDWTVTYQGSQGSSDLWSGMETNGGEGSAMFQTLSLPTKGDTENGRFEEMLNAKGKDQTCFLDAHVSTSEYELSIVIGTFADGTVWAEIQDETTEAREPEYEVEYEVLPDDDEEDLDVVDSNLQRDDGTLLQMNIAYTGEALCSQAGDGFPCDFSQTGSILAVINFLVNRANRILSDSQTGLRVEVVRAYRAEDYREGQISFSTTLNRMQNPGGGYFQTPDLVDLRNEDCADLVGLITRRGDRTRGDGSVIYGQASAIGPTRFGYTFVSSLESRAVSGYTFTHEIGHVLGCRHDIGSDPNGLRYAHGYDGGSISSVMTTRRACSFGCTRLPVFSNPPPFQFEGRTVGRSSDANNARRIRETKLFMTRLRDSAACSATPEPTPRPTPQPTPQPTPFPTPFPTPPPTSFPTPIPTTLPTSLPTPLPSPVPTPLPTKKPTPIPSRLPSSMPTTSTMPSQTPTMIPTKLPSSPPSRFPSRSPTNRPSQSPSSSLTPSNRPSALPSESPSESTSPSDYPSKSPTDIPSFSPSNSPTNRPSHSPSQSPTFSVMPSDVPSLSLEPSMSPSNRPSDSPSRSPTDVPSMSPSHLPSLSPSLSTMPSDSPSNRPSEFPSLSGVPSTSPSNRPSNIPSSSPTRRPTSSPSFSPSQSPTLSVVPSSFPSITPSQSPTLSVMPSNAPTVSSSPTQSAMPSPVVGDETCSRCGTTGYYNVRGCRWNGNDATTGTYTCDQLRTQDEPSCDHRTGGSWTCTDCSEQEDGSRCCANCQYRCEQCRTQVCNAVDRCLYQNCSFQDSIGKFVCTGSRQGDIEGTCAFVTQQYECTNCNGSNKPEGQACCKGCTATS